MAARPLMQPETSHLYPVRLYESLLRVRPAQLCDVLKKLLRVRRCYVRSATGQTFWVDPVSILGLHLMSDGLHEPQMCKLFEAVLRPGDQVIDVGGNEGYFSVFAAALVQDGQVHCVEPQTRLQPILRENVRVNGAHAIVVHQLALSDVASEVDLYLRPSTNTGASSFYRHWKLGSEHERVRTLRLDDFFEHNKLEQVRLLKVDCEGAEYQVIEGAKEVLARQVIEFIALEYHPSICGTEKCQHIHEMLTASGYTLTKAGDQCVYHLPGLESELSSLLSLRSRSD